MVAIVINKKKMIKKALNVVLNNILLLGSKIWYSFGKRDCRLWIFGEWFGERCCDNCLYFANYLATNHPDIKLVWISKKGTNLSLLDKRVECVIFDSSEASSYLKKAGVVLVSNGSNDISLRFKSCYSGALIVNLWHGVPWKKIHYDMPFNCLHLLYIKYRTKLFEGNVYLSLSEEFTKVLRSAFGCKESNIIKSGYPRNKVFYDKILVKEFKHNLVEYLKSINVKCEDSTIILTYMPTFRDNQHDCFSFESIIDNDNLQGILKQHDAIILQKSHFVSVHRKTYETKGEGRLVLLKDYPSQELLASSDILITDYSSCFFDYLLLDRPIIHYLYDYDYYANDDRGIYYPKEDVVGGDVATTVEELERSIEENLSNPNRKQQLREKRRNSFLQYESSHSCDTIYSEITSRLKIV